MLPALAFGVTRGLAKAPARRLPAPAVEASRPATSGVRTAVFSGGCFWGVRGVFSHVRGVTRAVSGYTGGQALTAHSDVVSSGLTGQAESVQVTYVPGSCPLTSCCAMADLKTCSPFCGALIDDLWRDRVEG